MQTSAESSEHTEYQIDKQIDECLGPADSVPEHPPKYTAEIDDDILERLDLLACLFANHAIKQQNTATEKR